MRELFLRIVLMVITIHLVSTPIIEGRPTNKCIRRFFQESSVGSTTGNNQGGSKDDMQKYEQVSRSWSINRSIKATLQYAQVEQPDSQKKSQVINAYLRRIRMDTRY